MSEIGKPVLDVLRGLTPQRRPVWLMRQAGRYLPEYRALRAEAGNFLKLCLKPEWATEITLQPVRRFDVDAAILFADILLIPRALGQNLVFKEGEGPQLDAVVTGTDILKLKYDDTAMAPVYETLRRVKSNLPDHTTLIGFCGAPWTVACYMIDGKNIDNFRIARLWAKEQPNLMQSLIDVLIEASDDYLSAQISAGAEVIQIFDSWAGLLTGDEFIKCVINPTRALIARLKRKYPLVPIIGFPREAGSNYALYAREVGIDCLSIDHTVSLDTAVRDLQIIKPLQGNLDPEILRQGGEVMIKTLTTLMQKFGPRHVINLGHGVVPQTPPEHVEAMVKHVHEFLG